MKKIKYLGVNGQYCCILLCHLPFEVLNEHATELESSDFIHDSTDWCGCDLIARTLEEENLILSGRSIKLNKPLIFEGEDCDMGHEYPWYFAVKEIKEVLECN